jgi:hypothetical protein
MAFIRGAVVVLSFFAIGFGALLAFAGTKFFHGGSHDTELGYRFILCGGVLVILGTWQLIRARRCWAAIKSKTVLTKNPDISI